MIKEGKRYISESGDLVGPMRPGADKFFEYSGDGRSWNPDGTCYTEEARNTSGNLLREVLYKGTIEEIGARVGDTVLNTTSLCKHLIVSEGMLLNNSHAVWLIVKRGRRSPVRVVTKKEIQPGVYGPVRIVKVGSSLDVRVHCEVTLENLQSIVSDLNDMIGALKETQNE